MNASDLLYGALCGGAIAVLTYFFRALRLSGSIAAFFVILLTIFFGGFPMFFVLLFTFIAVSAVGIAVKRKTEPITADKHEKSGARDGVQVFVNGFPAVLAAILSAVTGERGVFYAVYAAAVSEALGDSLASDVGVLSRRAPRDILTFRPAIRGMSGAVSLLGTAAALGGIAATALFAYIVAPYPAAYIPVFLIAPFAGVMFDSVLGSAMQAKRLCRVCGKITEKRRHCGTPTQLCGGIAVIGNDAVNLLSGLFSFAVATVWLLAIS